MTTSRFLRSAISRCAIAVRERVRIDSRSLALFRIIAGLLIVADVASRSRNLSFFYTDEGAVPRSLAVAAEPAAAYSVYMLAATPRATAVLFLLTALVGVALAAGYYTRAMTVVAFVLVVSLDLRNPYVLSFADTLFATLLFFAMFLPLGERWSVDAVAADRPRRESIASVGTVLILGQMVTMYVVNGYHKTASDLWWSGEATVLILGIDEITFLFGDALRAVPTLLQIGGFVWFVMLLGAWLLIVLRDRYRHLLVVAFASVHLSLALTVRIGAFSYVCLAGLVLFCQPAAWRDLRTASAAIGARVGGPTTVAQTGSTVGESWTGRVRSRSIGFAERCYRPVFTSPIGNPFPSVSPQTVAAASAFGVVLVAIGIVASLSAAGVVDDDSPRAELETGATALVEFQGDWSIFAPNPRTVDRYYVFPAKTTDGTVIDARNDRDLTFDRPYARLQRQHGAYRERFYMSSLPGDDDEPVSDHLATYLCETYVTETGARLTHVNFYLVSEEITRDTIDNPANRHRTEYLLSRHACGDYDTMDIRQQQD